MSKFIAETKVWLESTPEIRALDKKKLIVVGDLDRDLKIEDHPSDSKRVAVAATTLPLVDVPNQPSMTEGRAITGYLTKDVVHCLKPGSEFGYGDNYIVLDQDE